MKVAMLLAAGRGERLKPLTNAIPKALCSVNGLSLIEHHLHNLAAAGFEKVVINHAYLGGLIRQRLGQGERYNLTIVYSPEPPGGLETGGGLVQALPLLGDKPFLVVNADTVTDFDFASIDLCAVSSLHLVLVARNAALQHTGDFGLSDGGLLINSSKDYIFSGIACYHPSLFAGYTVGRYSLAPMIRQLAANNQATGELHTGVWFDIGSPERLEAANQFYSRSQG